MNPFLEPLFVQIDTSRHERRRRKRLFLSFPIEISGIDRDGRQFLERTKTEDISESGCRLQTKIPLETGTIVTIKLIAPPAVRSPEEIPVKFEIVWVAPENEGWTLGVRKVHQDKMWRVTFPE